MKKKSLLPVLVAFATFNFQFLNTQLKAQVCFTDTNSFALSGSSPMSITNADFNTDAKADLAVVNYGLNNVSLLFGNGFGGFDTTIVSFAVGSGPRSAISADFNGDGNADLAVANQNSNNVSLLYGNGSGGLTSAINFAVGSGPRSVISADFNGDGNADLAVANQNSNKVSVLLGDGSGGLDTAVNFSVNLFPVSVTSGDFNGDGKTDLATANYNSNNISVLFGNGLGGFAPAVNFAAGIKPSSVISGDFNGDGKTDLATANYNSNNISVLFGNGSGGFAPAVNFSVEVNPSSIISADFNGDGNADLAAVNYFSHSISVLIGNGSGGFAPAVNFSVAGNELYAFTCADFNGDGKTDFATANYYSQNVSVLLNNPLPVTANATDTVICAGSYLTLTGGGATSYSWTGGITDGVAFSAPSSTTTYTVMGTTGECSNVATKTIVVNPLPTATFTTQNESSSLYCDGSIKANLTGGANPVLFQWDSASTFLSSVDSIAGLCPGVYTLHLVDSNSCANVYAQTIQAGPIPPAPSICLITVDPAITRNVVVWEKTSLNMAVVDSFVVYREVTTNNYQRIGAVHADSLSVFDDSIANPSTTGFRYKLKCKNAHGVISLASDYHNTIYLTNTGANFSWTPYQVENNTTPVATYNVYRDDNSTGNFLLIGNTTGNQLGYTDINYSSYPNASYYVEAVMQSGNCNPTRSVYGSAYSNIKYVGTTGVQQSNNDAVIKIYPNPVNNILNITGISGKSTLRLYDVVGKIVIEKEVESDTAIYVSQLAEGIYTISVESKNLRMFNKVVVSH